MDAGVGLPQGFLGAEEKRGFLMDTAESSDQPRQICDNKTPLLPTAFGRKFSTSL